MMAVQLINIFIIIVRVVSIIVSTVRSKSVSLVPIYIGERSIVSVCYKTGGSRISIVAILPCANCSL